MRLVTALAAKCKQSLSALSRAWATLQVEHHGSYSVERLDQLHEYQRTTSRARAWAVIVLTPLPCLAVSALLDAIPLEPPSSGLAHSQLFWLRSFLYSWVITAAVLVQLRQMVPRLPVTTAQLLWMPLLTAAVGIAVALALASRIGYPLPFTVALSSPGVCLAYGACFFATWGKLLRRHSEVRRDVVHYYVLVIKQASLIYIYAVFSFMFTKVGRAAQPALALLLPLLKLAVKNWINASVHHFEDFKPEMITFNVEIFHSLYVAISLQTATSPLTMLLLMAVDFVHACFSLRRMHALAKSVTQTSVASDPSSSRSIMCSRFVKFVRSARGMRADPHRVTPLDATTTPAQTATTPHKTPLEIIRLARCMLELDPSILGSAGISARSCSSRRYSASAVIGPSPHALARVTAGQLPRIVLAASASVGAWHDSSLLPKTSPRSSLGRHLSAAVATQRTETAEDKRVSALSRGDTEKHMLNALSQTERCERVQRVLQLLHVAEFVTLVEYTEVMVPVVYCFYLSIMSRLPSRIYYAQLKDLDATTLQHNISNVLLYALLELASFLALSALLGKRFGVSSIHQLAFVLEHQSLMVQAKLVLWVVTTLQSPLEHYGADYSFQFKWLRSHPSHQ